MDNVPPAGHENCRRCMPVAPGVPITVHLVPEAQDDGTVIGTDGLSIGAQIAVVSSCGDRSDADVGRVHLHEWHGAVFGRSLCETNSERLLPSAVIYEHAGFDSGSCRE